MQQPAVWYNFSRVTMNACILVTVKVKHTKSFYSRELRKFTTNIFQLTRLYSICPQYRHYRMLNGLSTGHVRGCRHTRATSLYTITASITSGKPRVCWHAFAQWNIVHHLINPCFYRLKMRQRNPICHQRTTCWTHHSTANHVLFTLWIHQVCVESLSIGERCSNYMFVSQTHLQFVICRKCPYDQ